jgi:hypothetical protein
MKDTKTRARMDLLGEQWFQDRTGYTQREKIPNIDKLNIEDKLIVDTTSPLIQNQFKMIEKI